MRLLSLSLSPFRRIEYEILTTHLLIATELNFSIKGTCAGILSSLFVSLNSIFTKKILPCVQDNHWRLTWYNNMNASILFLPLILLFESGVIYEAMGGQLMSPVFWGAMTIAGAFGFRYVSKTPV